MYEYKGLQDIFFVMLYGGATLLAVMACLYLLLTRGNMFSSAINPPKTLRRWTAAFMASVAASHVWWVMLGMYWLTDGHHARPSDLRAADDGGAVADAARSSPSALACVRGDDPLCSDGRRQSR